VTALTLFGVLVGAPAASADQTWYQAIGRPSADAPCPATNAEDSAAGWSQWAPSWEEWPGQGHGGYVCTRSNTWAFESTEGTALATPSVGCLAYQSGNFSVDLEGGFSFPIGTQTWMGSHCGPTPSVLSGYNFVYAPGDWSPLALCQLVWPNSTHATYWMDPDLYTCSS